MKIKIINFLYLVSFYSMFFLLLVGCSTPIVRPLNLITHNGEQIEKEFLPYVKTFEKYYGKPIGISMRFQKLNAFSNDKRHLKITIGICSCFFFCVPSLRTIGVDLGNWEYSSIEEREELVLHELGHCILNRWHNDNRIKRKFFGEEYYIPESIMNSTNFGDSFSYSLNRDYYLKELFKKD